MDPVEFKNDHQEDNYDIQRGREHVSTMWYHRPTAESFGMHDDIQEAFGNIGAGSLLTMDYLTYPALTSEFLSSFDTDITGPNDTDGKVRFRIGNQKHSCQLRRWNRIFGFRNPTAEYLISHFNPELTWMLLTGMNYLPTGALFVKLIASPLFRVILRILGNTIWARTENSKPTKWEIACVYGMLFHPTIEMNLGWEFLKHLKKYKTKGGEVWFGGMITRIARHYEVDLDLYDPLGPSYINRHYLLHATVLALVDRQVSSRIEVNGIVHTIPISAEKMDLLYVPNWYETWTEVPRNEDSPPNWNPYTHDRLRRRGRRVYEGIDEQEEGQEEDEEQEDEEEQQNEERQDDVVMQEPQGFEWPEPARAEELSTWPAPTWQGPNWHDPRWQATGGASGSGGGGGQSSYNPDYPPFYNDLCSRFEGWNANFVEMRKSNEEVRKSNEEVRKSIEGLKTSFEKQNEEEKNRWEARNRRDQGLMTWARDMGYNPPPPPGAGDPPPDYFW